MPKPLHSEYYQAIIQLRPADPALMRYLEKRIDKDDKVWISKKLKVKGGVDYYISSNKFARQIGRKMNKSFDGVLKESRKLFGRDNLGSKDLWRVTVCFRLNPKEEDL